MIINEESRISDILKAKPVAIEVIASINKHFNKLRNPILRKLLASRVNVRDAARIGNIRPSTILKELQKIGFEIKQDTPGTPIEKKLAPIAPDSHQLSDANQFLLNELVVEMDVRPVLDTGTDPFNLIRKQINNLQPNQQLLIINSFEPVPLINMLKEKGFDFKTSRPFPGEVHTLFYKKNKTKQDAEPKAEFFENDETLFNEKINFFKDSIKTIDVRELEMPGPMVVILNELESLGKDQVLLVEHKKFPQFLLVELSARRFSMVSKKHSEQYTSLLIYRQ